MNSLELDFDGGRRFDLRGAHTPVSTWAGGVLRIGLELVTKSPDSALGASGVSSCLFSPGVSSVDEDDVLPNRGALANFLYHWG